MRRAGPPQKARKEAEALPHALKAFGDLGGLLVILGIVQHYLRVSWMFGNSLVRECVAHFGAKISSGLNKLSLGHAHGVIVSSLHSSF